jgi:polysaccharide export outer membrane protein
MKQTCPIFEARNIYRWLCGIGLLFVALQLSAAEVEIEQEFLSNYRLDSGDSIKIQVLGEPELSMDVRLTDAGTVAYPFLGEIKLTGLTIGEAQKIITQGLADGYLVEPKVTVTVHEYRQFFVNGEVKKPGGYPFAPGLTVRKAVSLAGGLTDYASERKITITRETIAGRSSLKVTMDDPVLPGDILEIGESFF